MGNSQQLQQMTTAAYHAFAPNTNSSSTVVHTCIVFTNMTEAQQINLEANSIWN